MWFKNLRLYQFTQDFTLSTEDLEERLANHNFIPCGKHDAQRYGWAPPLGRHGEQLTHSCNGYIMLCARGQEKILPAAVINEMVEEKALALQSEEGREVRRKERRDIRDDVLHELMPRALARTRHTYAFIAPKQNLLVIDCASAAKADELLNLLRESLGSLPVVPLAPRNPPVDTMTSWLTNNRINKEFSLGVDCDLRDPLDAKNIIRCRQQELASSEIRGHLEAGKQVIKLGIHWGDRIRATLYEDFSLRQLAYEDIIQQQLEEDDEADMATQFDNDFALMSLELTRFIEALSKACGISKT
jgi:recombination associated protein RdgC